MIKQLWAEWQDHLAQRLAIIISPRRQPRSAQILTADWVQQQPIAAPEGSEINHGIPPKYTEKRIRINFPSSVPVSFPEATPTPVRVGSFRGYPFVMIFLAGVDDSSSDNWQEVAQDVDSGPDHNHGGDGSSDNWQAVGQDIDSGPDHNHVAGRPVPEQEGRARPNRMKFL